MVSRRMTVYRNPSSQAAVRARHQETLAVAPEAQSRTQVQNIKTVSVLPVPKAVSASVYGFAFQSGPERLSVKAPGEVAAVSLSDHAALCVDVTHDAGSPELMLHIEGDYLIDFALYVTSDYAKQATFALQANGENIAGSVRDVSLRAGYQAVSGFAMAHLKENSHIRIVMTASSPIEVALTGCGTTAALSVRKL